MRDVHCWHPGGFTLGGVSPEPIEDCCVCAWLPGQWGCPLSDLQMVYACQSLVHLDEILLKLSRLRSHYGETGSMTLENCMHVTYAATGQSCSHLCSSLDPYASKGPAPRAPPSDMTLSGKGAKQTPIMGEAPTKQRTCVPSSGCHIRVHHGGTLRNSKFSHCWRGLDCCTSPVDGISVRE